MIWVAADARRDRHLYIQWYLPAVGGALYRASIWCRTQNLREGQPVIDLTFYGPDAKYLAPGVFVASGASGTHDWEQTVVEGRAPEGARLVTFRGGLNWAAGTLWFDDAELVQVDSAPATAQPVGWRFRIEGTPGEGAFAVLAEVEGRRDVLVFNPTGQAATLGGHTTVEPVALFRTP